MKYEEVSIETLAYDPVNARKHTAKNIDAIKSSLAKFGQQKPIVVSKTNLVIAGNGTLEAARALGWKKIKIARTDLTGSDATAFALADNRTSELAQWDNEILAATLKGLQVEDFDLGSLGWEDSDLKALLSDGKDPWGSEGEKKDKGETATPGEAHRILLIYKPEEYQKVLEMAENIMVAQEITDMSSLFKKLLEKTYDERN